MLETKRKSHFKVTTEQPVTASNRKSDDKDAPRSSVSYNGAQAVGLIFTDFYRYTPPRRYGPVSKTDIWSEQHNHKINFERVSYARASGPV